MSGERSPEFITALARGCRALQSLLGSVVDKGRALIWQAGIASPDLFETMAAHAERLAGAVGAVAAQYECWERGDRVPLALDRHRELTFHALVEGLVFPGGTDCTAYLPLQNALRPSSEELQVAL